DTTNSVLAGVSITVKDRRTIGTTTDLNGRYILNVPSGSTLVFSMVGYETQEIAVGGRDVIDVLLRQSSSVLDDVVVTAFGGTVKRTDMVGSVSTVRPDDLK